MPDDEERNLPVTHAPVLVIGSSMVGMTLSALLAKQGVEGCVAVEKHASTAIHPRAALFHPRTMQIYRELGLYEQMRDEASLHYDEHAGIVAVESLAGRFLASFMANMNEGLENISPTIRIFLTQQMFEPMLRQIALRNGANLQFSTELVDFDQDDEGVTAVVRNVDTGSKRIIRAEYMVASDGNRSAVREKLGIKMKGYGLLSRSLTIYFEMEVSNLANSKHNGVIYVNNDKVRGFFRLDKTGHDCFLVVFTAGERGTEESRFPADHLTDDGIAQLLKEAIGADVDFKITLVAQWEAVCDVAEQFSKGRVLLVGDAVHTVTPHGGYGGNTGIQDAHNLAWKLALVLKGQAHPALVQETYHQERYPVGKQTVDLVYEHYLTRTAPELRKGPPPENLPPDVNLELGYRYHSRAVDSEELGSLTEDPAHAKASPGSLAHHVLVDADGDKQIPIANLLGEEFALLLGADATGWAAAAETVFASDSKFPNVRIRKIASAPLDKQSQSASGQHSDFYTRYATSTVGAVLVRPDGIVAWSTAAAAVPCCQVSVVPDPVSELADVMRRILCYPSSAHSR